jgi:DNA-binding transcriptional ArsR family regulator
MNLRGRCQQILTVLRERGPQSIRKLAQATGLPKSSVDRHCKRLRERARQAPEAELWEQERGAQWLRVLVLAVLFVFGLKGGVGVERLSEFFHRVRLERYLAVSPSALRSLRTQMEAVILAYSVEQEQRFGQTGRRLEIIAGADETFFDQVVVLVMMDLVSGYLVLEEAADNRTYDTWQERVQAAMTRVGLALKYVVSDRAKALIKLALTGLGCPSVPDLFHALRDLAKVMGVSLRLKLAQVEEKLTHARQQLGVLEAKGHDTHVQQRLLAHLSARAEGLRADRATGQSTLQQASQAVHPFTLAESQAQSSAQVESQLHQAVATLNTLHAAHTARDNQAAVTKFQRQIPGIAALVDAWWLGVEHRLAPLALDEPTQSWFQQQLLPVVYWQAQVEKTKTPALKTAYQQAFRQAQAALLQHPLTATVTPPALETYHAWARDLAGQFQRASSAVEGRNGYLSQLNHCARGTPTQRLKVMTVLHNFDLKRADGTTAAERLFRTSFPDLFDWMVERMAPLPVPRKPRTPAKFNPLKLLTVPA